MSYPKNVESMIQNNDITALDKAKENGEIDSMNIYTVCTIACRFSKLDAIKWITEHYPDYTNYVCSCTLIWDNFEFMKELHANGYPLSSDIAMELAENSKFDLLKWAFKNGCPPCKNVCIILSRNQHFDMLKWAIEQGYPYDNSRVLNGIVASGDIELLKWITELGCTFNEVTYKAAIHSGSLEMIKYLMAEGCPFEDKNVISVAGGYGHLNIVKWAVAEGFPCGWYSWISASINGKLEVLKWAKDNGPGFSAAGCLFQTPINERTFDTIIWLREVSEAKLANKSSDTI